MDFTPEALMGLVVDFGFKLVAAIVIIIVGRFVAGILRRLVRRLCDRAELDESLTRFLSKLTYILIMIFTLVAAVGKFGVETASFVAVLGAAGFAIGFALQGSLSNFASGVMLLLFRPFKSGDFIDAAGVAGKVEAIQLFNTILATPDNVRIIMPNSKVFGDVIRNFSVNTTRRVDVTIGIGYGSSIDDAFHTAKEVIQSDSRVLPEPEPMVAVTELADSSVNLIIRAWVNAGDYWGVKFDLNKNLKESFDAKGIEIPFPQRVVHMVGSAGE